MYIYELSCFINHHYVHILATYLHNCYNYWWKCAKGINIIEYAKALSIIE